MKKIAQGIRIEHLHHKGIIHRDLKTDNIALYEQDVELMPVILDFGKDFFKNTHNYKYNLTKDEKKKYRIHHKHIAPDLVDGLTNPTSASNMYSYGQIIKTTASNFPIAPQLIPSSMIDMINDCLSYDSSLCPTAKAAVITIQSAVSSAK